MAEKDSMRLAVIGSGVCGLAAAAVAVQAGVDTTIFTKDDDVGGLWRYGGSSPMYASLRTNLPTATMELLRWPMEEGVRTFPSHEVYARYLRRFSDAFNLLSCCRFRTEVTAVERVDASTPLQISWRSLDDEAALKTEPFTHLLVANGHYSEPEWPELEGLSDFEGRVMHSVDYRTPEAFAGLHVVVIGAGNSAIDISIELAGVAAVVYNARRPLLAGAARRDLQLERPSNLVLKPPIARCLRSAVVFADGSQRRCDVIISATGYRYSFPFLPADVLRVQCGGRRVAPLYKQLFAIEEQRIGLIGIVWRVLPAVVAEYQAQLFLAVARGDAVLPSAEDMLAAEAAGVAAHIDAGEPERYAHRLGPLMFDYFNDLADAAAVERPPAYLKQMAVLCGKRRAEGVLSYRSMQFWLDRESGQWGRVAADGRRLESEAGEERDAVEKTVIGS